MVKENKRYHGLNFYIIHLSLVLKNKGLGTDINQVLGHSTIQVTERYSHLAPDKLQMAAKAINQSIKKNIEGKMIPFKKKAL